MTNDYQCIFPDILQPHESESDLMVKWTIGQTLHCYVMRWYCSVSQPSCHLLIHFLSIVAVDENSLKSRPILSKYQELLQGWYHCVQYTIILNLFIETIHHSVFHQTKARSTLTSNGEPAFVSWNPLYNKL